jgi:hypothetical protein
VHAKSLPEEVKQQHMERIQHECRSLKQLVAAVNMATITGSVEYLSIGQEPMHDPQKSDRTMEMKNSSSPEINAAGRKSEVCS